MIALHALLEKGVRAGATPVCREHDVVHDFDAFRRRVRAIARAVQKRPERRYALCLDNAFDFACALFALLACAREPVIPGSFAPGYLAALAGACDVLMTDDELRRLEAEGDAAETAKTGTAAEAGIDAGIRSGAETRAETDAQAGIDARIEVKTAARIEVKTVLESAVETSAKTPRENPASPPDDMPGHIDPHAPLVLYTSGSSDVPKAVRKSLAQFDAEVLTQERQWGALPGDALVLASVPHHHIYGILFRIFWPLAAGRAFDCNVVTDPATLDARLGGNDANDDARASQAARAAADENGNAQRDAGRGADDGAHAASHGSAHETGNRTLGRAAIVISTPAHLSRWPALPGFDSLGASPGASLTFFSSGGPLDDKTADLYAAKFGSAPIEIYGSTETGGIAWRRQNETQRWQPLPGVEVRIGAAAASENAPENAPEDVQEEEQKNAPQNAAENAPEPARENAQRDAQKHTLQGALEIRSAHLGHSDWHRTDDEIALDVSDVSGSANASRAFTLLGRLDRVVKIDGKRVSLAALEARLGAHPGIAQAVAVALDGKARTRVGVLAALNAAGRAALREHGHARFASALRQSLLAHFDLATVPRQWRFASTLPFDARGKLPASVVRARFATHPLGFDLLSEFQSGDECRYELRVPHGLTYFAGHFPGLPILPGVVQVDWAVQLAAAQLGRPAVVASLDRLKFTAPVPPGARLGLTLTHDAARGRTRFVYARDVHDAHAAHDGRAARVCASGILVWADAP